VSFQIPALPPSGEPPRHADGRRVRAERIMDVHDATAQLRIERTPVNLDEDETLLRRLDANELLDIHQGLNWCERELRALSPLCVAQRRRVAALRRRWARRWRVATGRPAISLQAHRAWQLAAILGVGITLVGALSGPDEQAGLRGDAAPLALPPAATPVPTVTAPPEPVPPAPSVVAVTTQPDRTVTDEVAQSRARRVARTLSRCRRERGSFTACPEVMPPQPMPHVALELTELTFRIDASSHSGNIFTIIHSMNERYRDCTSRGVGRCPASGSW
jgi:hypothetical protein